MLSQVTFINVGLFAKRTFELLLNTLFMLPFDVHFQIAWVSFSHN